METSVNRYVVSWILLRRIQQSKDRGNEGLRVGSTEVGQQTKEIRNPSLSDNPNSTSNA